MEQVIFVMWRESVEALLVVGILHSWLSRTPGAESGRRWLWGGVVAGLVLAGLLGAGIYSAQELLANWQDQFQTLMVLVAAALIAQMVLWMRAHGRTLKRELEQGLTRNLEHQNWWGVAVLAALAIAREGSEAVVFLYGTLAAAPASDLPLMGIAALGGLLAAVATFWLLQLGSKVMTWPRFFRITEILLLLLAASLVVTGVEKMQALEWLPPLVDGIWDTSWLLPDMGRVGGLVAGLTGYRAQPSLMTVLAFVGYWLLMAWLLSRTKAGTPQAQRARMGRA
ncbi:MAG: FTR1 family iron permease [Comamonas sp. SCN 65-56]|uniref:FTR1 family iron permease n=1 Tax=Comamonas sp. SCN 65-56 TaxID=1660095 RepID=UPI00086E1055|nr:FTR1 family protein [Comamonas sp. SCN 65-56]ODS90569.1 MAG: FTR1 family iron permease [Comamonas sp. SCN 65-56]